MSSNPLGMLSLKNEGWFVARIQFHYWTGSGAKQLSKTSNNILIGQTLTVTPSDLGVPDGYLVSLRVEVVAGRNNDASETYLYQSTSGMQANYTISGTTLDNKLVLNSYSVPTWANWSANLVHTFPASAPDYYFPSGRDALKAIIGNAAAAGVKLRSSGQRHSQPPLVIEDNRSSQGSETSWLVDMSCYADLGTGTDRIVMGKDGNTVTCNTGVREDELDSFLTGQNKMLKTVTAGGFFSIGGMTAVDVHGATVTEPIFAETAIAYNFLGWNGSSVQEWTIDAATPPVGSYSPLQFARVSLGSLGIVTSVTLSIQDRPYATTLSPSKETYTLSNKADFVAKFKTMLKNNRIETFYNPYSSKFLSLIWNIDPNPSQKTPNSPQSFPDVCESAHDDNFGAPYEGILEPFGEAAGLIAQASGSSIIGSGILDIAFAEIESLFNAAVKVYSDLWLSKAARVIFMSYFVELPDIDDAGVGKVWDGLNVVTNRLNSNTAFMLAGPLEFRFIKGGDAAMAGTYTTNPNSTFLNLDLIAFVKGTEASDYPQALLDFFADIERQWVAMGGFPHNGKMYGFYDPTQPTGSTAPFNPNYLNSLRARRGDRLVAFNSYRQQCDPSGLFENAYVKSLLGN